MRSARYIPAVEFVQAVGIAPRSFATWESFQRSPHRRVGLPAFRQPTHVDDLMGHPAVCLPVGFLPAKDEPADSPRRMTGAISFTARLYRDSDALTAAHAFQQATDFHRRRPPIA